MSHATSAPTRAHPPDAATAARPTAGDGYQVVFHEPICPTCGSFDVTETDVDTGGGLTETALACRRCGQAWPIACVVEWDGRP